MPTSKTGGLPTQVVKMIKKWCKRNKSLLRHHSYEYEDVRQIMALYLFKKLDKYIGNDKPPIEVIKITKHIVRMQLYKLYQRMIDKSTFSITPYMEDEKTEEDLEQEEPQFYHHFPLANHEHLGTSISQKHVWRLALLLLETEEYDLLKDYLLNLRSQREIAEEKQISYQTVNNKINVSLKKLRDYINRYGYDWKSHEINLDKTQV